MTWLSVTIEVAADEVEAISDALLEAGAASVEVADGDAGSPAERPVFAEPGSTEPRPWQRSVVTALVAAGADAGKLIADACASAGIASAPYRTGTVAEKDWVRASQDQFAPIRVSPRL